MTPTKTPLLQPWLLWVLAHVAGLPVGFGLAVIPEYALNDALAFAGQVGAVFLAFATGAALGLPLGALQWVAIRRAAAPAPWVLGTVVGAALGATAFAILAAAITALRIPVLEDAVRDLSAFGTGGYEGQPLGVADTLARGVLWLALGALLGGGIGLGQWAVRPGRMGPPLRWAVVNLAAGGLALVVGAALRGLVWELSGAYETGMVGINLCWTIASIIVGLMVTGALWGLGTWRWVRGWGST